jgi:hypothetical protein
VDGSIVWVWHGGVARDGQQGCALHMARQHGKCMGSGAVQSCIYVGAGLCCACADMAGVGSNMT